MNNEQDIETTVRVALHEAARSTPAAPDLAQRLITNATSGNRTVVYLPSARRFTIPLLAAAACMVVIAGIVLGTRFAADRTTTPPATVSTPSPTRHETGSPTGSQSAPQAASSSIGAATSPAPKSGTGGQSSPATGRVGPVTVLPTATGVPQGFRAAALDFQDARTGWAIGDAKCPSESKTSCPALIRTETGGASWHRLSVPQGLASATIGIGCEIGTPTDVPCVNRVSFADERVGYLWSYGMTFVTTDGGASWKKDATAAHTNRLLVFGSQVVRVRQEQLPTPSQPVAPSVIETAPVGTDTFTAISLPWSGTAGNFDLLTAGDRTLFVVGDDGSGGAQYFRTTDAKNWERWIIGDPCGAARPSPYGPTGALDGSLIFQCSDGLRVAAGGSKTVGRPRPVPIANTEVQWWIDAAASAKDFAVVSEQADEAGRSMTSWYRTRDGGATWDVPVTFGDTSPTRGAGSSLVLVPGAGFGTTPFGDALLFSFDGGSSWQSRSF